MRRVLIISACFVLALVGCGDDDPQLDVDPNKRVADVTEVDKVRICEWGIELNGGEGKVHYCDGFTVTIETVEECTETALWWQIVELECDCDLTVGELEACERERAEDICTFNARQLASCETAFECLDECRGVNN